MPTNVTGIWGDPLYMLTLIATFGGTIGLLLSRHVRAHERLLALAVVLVGTVSGPALIIAIAVSEGETIALPARYGTSLMPWMLACGALLMDSESRTARWSAVAFGVAALTMSLALGEGA
jgi:peptidoglycan/LPS O-acetylase OafA/YrhL